MEFQWLDFLPVKWNNALYSTLFHSLWIGIVMVLIAGIIIMCIKNSRSSLRYNLLTTLLGVFSLGMIWIFYQSLNQANPLFSYFNPPVSNSNQLFKTNFANDIQNILTTLGTYADQLLVVWFGVILIKAIKLMLGLQGVHHLKRTKVFDAGAYWQNKLNELSQQLYIKQSVLIFQSGIAKIPMVIGHLKPIILMPIGMLNHLSLTEVEAILSHELAHIKRKDYLVNILQNILEVLFFFNPAVLWVSKMIKEERENCCDDLAISCTKDKNGYLRALVSCQEFNLNTTGFAMSMANGKGQLIARIRRIAFNKRASLGGVEKTLLAISLLFVFALSMSFTLGEKPNLVAKAASKKVQTVVEGSLTELATTNISQLKKLEPIENKMVAPIKETAGLNNLDFTAAHIEGKNINKPSEPLEICAKLAPLQPLQADVAPVSGTISTTTSTTTTTVKIDGKVTVLVTFHDKDARNDIKKDMLNDSIITIGENPSYILNKDEMLVNGIKQDANTHQKYKEKYITSADTQYRIGS